MELKTLINKYVLSLYKGEITGKDFFISNLLLSLLLWVTFTYLLDYGKTLESSNLIYFIILYLYLIIFLYLYIELYI